MFDQGRCKALTLDLHPELLVEHPGAAPAVCHVLYELPRRELLAQPVSNDLVWIESELWENIHVDQKDLGINQEENKHCCRIYR